MNAHKHELLYGRCDDDFRRLATGLRAAVVDFDYYRTRKLLDPNWDGYTMPKDHDFVHTDIDLGDANLLTSQHRDNPDMHRIVLDLDYGVTQQLSLISGVKRLRLIRETPTANMRCGAMKYLVAALPPQHVRARFEYGVLLNLDIHCDYALIESSSPGNHHLILDVNLPWEKYRRLLRLAADTGIIEPGYAAASIRRGFSAIRPPWIRKPERSRARTAEGIDY